ncbi:uncharacterized protein PRCAT00003951001 [Priceomyces carsonii]|uniref:uncharacterized protein n=1 Tax=Priceomyces carsonii TaxID=28549 RepID=UPI002ED82194|nr:unnamed protein product [Priceomyces carsonii]
MGDDSQNYQLYLRSLDDSQFISHFKNLSQRSDVVREDSFQAQSTLSREVDVVNSFTSTSTDPFNDGLDDELLKLVAKDNDPANVTDDDEVEQLQENFGDAADDNRISNSFRDKEYDEVKLDEEDPEVGPVHEFGDFGLYFRNKLIKQQKSDIEYIKWENKRRRREGKDQLVPVFQGCIIHVNGYTVPSINEIHRLVILHGGKFLSYLGKKSAATHIICDRLTPRKRIEFKNCRVVKAKWIVDSVDKHKLLNWFDYRLIEDIEYGQTRLEFGAAKASDSYEENEGSQQMSERDRVEGEGLLEELVQSEPLKTESLDDIKLNSGNTNAIDARHPEFLKHFFAKSRLHHLSTWKADLRLQFLRRIIKEEQHTSQNKAKINERLILHIDFDCFFATASCLNYPNIDVKTQPVAVSHGTITSDVASCNYVARSFGVKNGMWMRSARRKCPNLITLNYDFDSYENRSTKFYDYLVNRHIFDSIFPVLIDEVLVDASSYCDGPDFQASVEKLCQEIRRDVFSLTQCPVSIGASHNVLLARLALRKAKPDGYFHLKDNVEEFLREIPLTDLPGIGENVKHRLITELKMEGKTPKENPVIEDLLFFSELKLSAIFGEKTGKKLHQYARGISEATISIDISNSEAALGRKSLSVEVNYGIRFDKIEQADFFLMQISEELHSRLVKLRLCGSNLSLKLARRSPDAPLDPPKYLGMGICDSFSKSSSLGVPTNDWGVVGSELKSLFRIINVPIHELRGIGVTMTKLEDIEVLKKNRQRRLPFETGKPAMDTGEDSKKRKSKDNVLNSLPDEDIDWDVFKELPQDIKKELLSELRRRFHTSSEFPSPVKRQIMGKLPSKLDRGTKVYLQQLLPSQSGNQVKYIRTIESPTKLSKKRQKVVRNNLPTKNKSPEFEINSSSYDSSVLNELPSSVRNDVLKDIEYKKKIKKFDLVPLKEKIENKYKKQRSKVQEISSDWISNQRRSFATPLFLNRESSFPQIKSQLEGWVSSSLRQNGPHPDDVSILAQYFRDLLNVGSLNRCLILLEWLRTNIECEKSLLKSGIYGADDHKLIQNGIEDWEDQMNKTILPVIDFYCKINNINATL